MTEAEAAAMLWNDMGTRLDRMARDMHRQRVAMLFLFGFLVVALVVASVRSQIADNRLELERWQLCQERAAGIVVFNSHIPVGGVAFALPDCGPDPRTD